MTDQHGEITRIHVDWAGVPAWRRRLSVTIQMWASVTLSRWLGATITVERDD